LTASTIGKDFSKHLLGSPPGTFHKKWRLPILLPKEGMGKSKGREIGEGRKGEE